MSHYLPAAEARVADTGPSSRCWRSMRRGSTGGCTRRRSRCAAFIPAVIMLLAARALGARTAELVRYAHSGEVGGDDDRVVGYAGVLVR